MFLSSKSLVHLATLVYLLDLLSPNTRAQVPSTLADSVVWLSHPKLKSLLAQPGGLAQAAGQAGHLVVESYNAVPQPMDLVALSKSSDAIALCKVLGQSSGVDGTTNIVTTRVHLQVDERFKGSIPRDIYIDIPGGRVVFASDAFADIRTIETKGVGNGLELLVYLSRKSDPSAFKPTNGMEGIFWVSLSSGLVTSITRYDGHAHSVKSTSLTLAVLRNQLVGVTVVN